MSRPGHCNHCEGGCRGGTPIPAWPYPEPHINDNGAEWPEKCCPACAAADLIDAERQTLIPSDSGDFQHGAIQGLLDAARIARGES